MKKPPRTVDTERLLRASELQTALGMSRAKVYRLMQDGTLPTVRIGGSIRVPLRALAEWIVQRTRPGRVMPRSSME